MRWSSIVAPILLTTIQLFNCDPLDKNENDQRLNSCGKMMQSKVYQGRDAQQSEAPWSVFFLNKKPPNAQGQIFSTTCTGTVVSPRHVLFATHCFADLQDDASWKMNGARDDSNCKDDDYVITDKSFLEGMELQSNGVMIADRPEKVTMVNGCLKRTADKTKAYQPLTPQYFTDDFAIIDLYEDLKFSNTLQAVCIAKDSTVNQVSTSLEYYGFGLNPPSDKSTNDAEDNSGKLRHETIKVIDKPMEDYYFIAGSENKKTVACVGDSGGGAIGTINGKKTIVGVLSQTNCADEKKRIDPIEQYASVGYYNERICQLTGICNSQQDHEKYHKDYVKKEKPVRPTKAPIVQNPDGVQVQRPVGVEPDAASEKYMFMTLVLTFVALMI